MSVRLCVIIVYIMIYCSLLIYWYGMYTGLNKVPMALGLFFTLLG